MTQRKKEKEKAKKKTSGGGAEFVLQFQLVVGFVNVALDHQPLSDVTVDLLMWPHTPPSLVNKKSKRQKKIWCF